MSLFIFIPWCHLSDRTAYKPDSLEVRCVAAWFSGFGVEAPVPAPLRRPLLSSLQEADLAVAPLTITSMRQRFVDMTTPFMQTGISFVVRKDAAPADDHGGYFRFLCPFSTETWVGILAAYLMVALCMWTAAR